MIANTIKIENKYDNLTDDCLIYKNNENQLLKLGCTKQ